MIPPCTSPHRPSLQLPLVPTQVTPFHSSRPPAITVKSYLEDRILKYAGCSEETFILALIYMDQVRTIASAPRGNVFLLLARFRRVSCLLVLALPARLLA